MANEKVLIIEDRRQNLVFLASEVLRPNGYQVIAAMDGETGLRQALTGNPDLIITDLRIPKLNGIEVMRALRRAGKETPVIISTFHGSEELAIEAFRLGATDYLIKPYEIEQMLAAVDRALAPRRTRAQRPPEDRDAARVNRMLRRRVRELIILSGIGKAVISLHQVEAVLQRIVEAAQFLAGAQEAFLMLVDKDTGDLHMRAIQGMDRKYRSFQQKVDDSIAGQVVRTGEPIRIGREAGEQAHEVMTGYLVTDLLNVPLKVRGAVIGVLGVVNVTPRSGFTENDENLLSALGEYAAIAIDNASLYELLNERAREMSRVLTSQSRDVSRLKELDDRVRRLTEREQRFDRERQQIAEVAESLGNLYIRLKAIDARITGPASEQ